MYSTATETYMYKIYIYIYTYTYIYMYIHTHTFLRFFSLTGYYVILSIVHCVIQKVLVGYLFIFIHSINSSVYSSP